MAIRIIDEYPGQVGAPDVNYPEGVPRNVTSPGGGDGTPWEASLLKDMQGLMQGLLAQVPAGPIVPSGVPDTVLISQYIDAMKLITQGLDTLTFANAETDTTLRLAPDGIGNSQWILNIAEQLATAVLNSDLVLKPDGLGGVVFGTVPIAGGGGLKSTQVFDVSGTWNRPAGINLIKVTTVGGGGGGASAVNVAGERAGAGGGAGASSSLLIDVSAIPTETVTIGAAGAGGVAAGNSGGNGGTSTFGALTSSAGGFGGAGGGAGTSVGGLGGAIPALGDVKNGGGAGGAGPNGFLLSGYGGASIFGGGGAGVFDNVGLAALAYGAGGSGSQLNGGFNDGGAGRVGVIVVEEYS